MLKKTETINQHVKIEKSWIGNFFISKISKIDLLGIACEWIEKGEKSKYVTAINVSKVVMMQKDKKLSEYVFKSSINIADGFPIYLATHLIGDPIPERITGIDFMEALIQLANNKSYSVFFLGSKPKVLNTVISRCRTQYPDLKIAGSQDGYFEKSEEPQIVQKINSASPDILLVALGLPQKEHFVHDYITRLNATITLPVGGAFDVFAGTKKRAPLWTQSLGIEWLWRAVYDRSRAMLIFKSFLSFSFILISEIYRQRVLVRLRK